MRSLVLASWRKPARDALHQGAPAAGSGIAGARAIGPEVHLHRHGRTVRGVTAYRFQVPPEHALLTLADASGGLSSLFAFDAHMAHHLAWLNEAAEGLGYTTNLFSSAFFRAASYDDFLILVPLTRAST